jgi:AGZA family xanthine/uracil permease-like MFS transporter
MTWKSISHEIIAGLTTFFTMVYLLVLCPQLLSEGGVDFGAALTATVLTTVSATLFLSLYAGYPIVAGPGLSVLTYLVFSVIGKKIATWQEALGLVFWGGLIFLLLSLFRLRQKMIVHIPLVIKKAAPAGLGLFLIMVGLKQLGVVIVKQNGYALGLIGSVGQWIALAGILIFCILQWRRSRFSFLLPIVFCWLLALFLGYAEWKGGFSLPPSLRPTWNQLDLSVLFRPVLWTPLLGVLLLVLVDSSTMLSVFSRLLGWSTPQNLNRVVIPDGACSMLAGFLGTTSCLFYAESSSGICAGGRSFIVSCTAAFCCLGALFCYPALSSIPLFATAPALIGLGGILMLNFREIEWKRPTEWITFLVTSLSMLIFFSIYWGFALGFISFVILKTATGKWREIHPIVWILALIFALHTIVGLLR